MTPNTGETYFVSSTLRAYNAHLDRWELASAEEGGGLQSFGTTIEARRIGPARSLGPPAPFRKPAG